jgi:transposase
MIISGDDPVSTGAQRFEVFTGAGKRREWPQELKASIVAECCPGRGSVSAVARRHGLDPSQIYVWRKDLRKQLEAKGLSLLSAEPEEAMFVPAVMEVVTPAASAPPRRKHQPRRAASTAVELEIDGVAVKIAQGADAGVIGAVIEALRRAR